MNEHEEESNQEQDAERERALGSELLFFTIGLGVVLFGLLFVLTGIGGLVGIGMIFLGGFLCLLGAAIGVVVEWRTSRHKKS